MRSIIAGGVLGCVVGRMAGARFSLNSMRSIPWICGPGRALCSGSRSCCSWRLERAYRAAHVDLIAALRAD